MAGLTERRSRSPQTAQRSTCRPTRWRSSGVSPPSHPASSRRSPAQSGRPVRATSSAPNACANWPRPGRERVPLIRRDIQDRGQVGAHQAVPEAQPGDLAVSRREAADRGQHQAPQLRALGPLPDAGAGAGGHGGLIRDGRPGTGAQPPGALVPGDRVEPGAEAVSVPQPAELDRGDDKGVLDRAGGVRGLAQQAPAVGVQARCVPVIDRSQPGGIPGYDRGDSVAVPHASTVNRENCPR